MPPVFFDNGDPKGFLAGFTAAAQVDETKSRIKARGIASQVMQEEHQVNMNKERKRLELQRGMKLAAEAGGISAVMDYLDKNDPVAGLDLRTKKAKLDQELAKTEIVKSQKGLNKLRAMNEAYGILGTVGASVINAQNPQDAAAIYKASLPMIKTVNPEAPDSYNSEARDMLMFSANLASPKSQSHMAGQLIQKLDSPLGKLSMDINRLIASGVADDDPGLLAMKAKRDKYLEEKEKLRMTERKANYVNLKDQLDVERKITGDFRKASEKYQIITESYNGLIGAYNNAQNLPEGASKAAHHNAMIRMVARMFDKGVLTDADVEGYKGSDPIVMMAQKMFMKVKQGHLLTPSEEQRLLDLAKGVYDSELIRHQGRIRQFKGMASRYNLNPGFLDNAIQGVGVSAQKPKPSQEELEMVSKDPSLMADFITYFGADNLPKGRR